VDVESIRRAVLQTITAIAPEVDPARLRADLPLREQIELDSIDWLNVIAALEQRLGVALPPATEERLATLDALVAYLAARPAHAVRRAPLGLQPSEHVIGGVRVTVRPLRREDLPLEAEFVRSLSDESRYLRFQVAVRELPPAKLDYLTDVDQRRHVALVATTARDGREAIIGVARYVVDDSGSGCEFAIAVQDAWHRSGLAGVLMQALIDVARERGLRTMQGSVLATNARMLKFVRQLGFTVQHDPDDARLLRVTRTL
jgi:acetyltransferase